MAIKTINSTQAQNNFGSLLEDVSENGTQYLVQRFGRIKAVIVPLSDYRYLMQQRQKEGNILREVGTIYSLGQVKSETDVQQLIIGVEDTHG